MQAIDCLDQLRYLVVSTVAIPFEFPTPKSFKARRNISSSCNDHSPWLQSGGVVEPVSSIASSDMANSNHWHQNSTYLIEQWTHPKARSSTAHVERKESRILNQKTGTWTIVVCFFQHFYRVATGSKYLFGGACILSFLYIQYIIKE